MSRILLISFLLIISSPAFCQTTADNISKGGKDAIRENDFYFTLDEKKENLVVPSDNNGFRLQGLKIFSYDEEELMSAKIDPALNPNVIPVSQLANGDYFVHLVTVEQVLYITRLVISR